MSLKQTKAAFSEPARTEGVSPKTILAGVIPSVITVAAVVIQWVVTGEFDRAELATSLTGFVTALGAAAGAWAASPGVVTVKATVGAASDDVLLADPDVRERLTRSTDG